MSYLFLTTQERQLIENNLNLIIRIGNNMPKHAAKPLIGLTACVREIGIHPFHVVGEKYITAVIEAAGGIPLVLPSISDAFDNEEFLYRIDGLLFTGSQSNIQPNLYETSNDDKTMFYDPQRDASTLPLIRKALHHHIPMLCICRGFQELNVALGGTLYQAVHDIPGRLDHREDTQQPREIQYAPIHDIEIEAGGMLDSLWHKQSNIRVNSLHAQGVKTPAPDLRIEAIAPDGQIEALSTFQDDSFCLGVQWHPEWKPSENAFSGVIFEAFGTAARKHAQQK